VRPDPAAGARWFARAAERGDGAAQTRLARCYATGVGVGEDLAEAFKWLTLASEGGDARARRLCESIGGELSTRERWEARRRADEWTQQREREQSDCA
jgi:TPR repeat protein